MPIIQGADLTTVETGFKNYPEGAYKVLIKEVNFFRGKEAAEPETANQIRVITEILEAEAGNEFIGKPFTHFINFRNADGTLNQYGLADVKRYLEAIYGKKSPESATANTDLMLDRQVTLYLNERPDKNDPAKLYQNVKQILPA